MKITGLESFPATAYSSQRIPESLPYAILPKLQKYLRREKSAKFFSFRDGKRRPSKGKIMRTT